MLFASFYPSCEATSFSSVILTKSNEIFNMFVYVLRNVDANCKNIISYEVGYDSDEETIDIGGEIYDALVLEQLKKVTLNGCLLLFFREVPNSFAIGLLFSIYSY